jgi:hypothetical protein
MKSGFAVATWSNCEEPVRNTYLLEMTDYAAKSYNTKVSQMGKCHQNDDTLQTLCDYSKGQDAFKAEVVNVTRPFKFSLVFQNNDCEYFIDDRLSMAFAAHSVPVIMAHTPTVKKVLGKILSKYVIWVSDFKGPYELVDFLIKLGNDKKRYESYLINPIDLPSIRSHYSDHFTGGVNTKLYCRACTLAMETMAWGRVLPSFVGPDICSPRSPSQWLNNQSNQF